MAAAFCCRILRSAAQEGRKGFFLCGKLVCGFLREACAQDSAGGARVAFFSRGLLGGAFLRELFFAFYAQTRRNFLGGLASLRRRRFFTSLCLLRGSLLGGCAQCAMRRVKICARTFFCAIFLRLAPRRNESWRNFNLMACGCARRFSSPPFGCNLHGAHGRFWNNFADFFAGFFFAPILHFALFCANCTIIMGVAAYCNRLAPF